MRVRIDHPAVRAYLAHPREVQLDPYNLLGFVDHLQELGADDGDLCLLHAGPRRRHDGGVPQEVLAAWLECRGDPRGAVAVRALGVDPEEVALLIWNGTPISALAGDPDAVPAELRNALREAVARAGRDLKRKVLSLPAFGGVRLDVRFAVSEREAFLARRGAGPFLCERLLSAGLRPDLAGRILVRRDPLRRPLLLFEQTLAAPDLIWPENDFPLREAAARLAARVLAGGATK